jgi:hypothetical protein
VCVPVPFVSSQATFSPAERLARLIDGLCKAVAARGPGGFLAAPLLLLLWARLKQASVRILRLAARARAGKRSTPRAAPLHPVARQPLLHPPRRLPHRAGWLLGPVPDARALASQLRSLLAEPDMAALLEAAPGIERLLRPLCRMLGVARPKPPPRATPRSRAAPRKPPPPLAPPREALARWRLRPRRAPPMPPYTPWSPDPA